MKKFLDFFREFKEYFCGDFAYKKYLEHHLKNHLKNYVATQQKKIKDVLENQIKKNLILKKEDFQKRLV